tara:strand:+ start:138 stop:395 length:258 start_codon:yes stop_codon:yes gene_type:complete
MKQLEFDFTYPKDKNQLKWTNTYTVHLTGSDIERINYVFGEELSAYESNEPTEDYINLIHQTKSVLRKIKPMLKKFNLGISSLDS